MAFGVMAYVGHYLGIKDDLSVLENLRFMRDFLGTSSLACKEIIQQVGLSRVAEQQARTLSAGQRKRCALARLLVSDSRLWLLDEPYSNLDVEGIELVDSMLRSAPGIRRRLCTGHPWSAPAGMEPHTGLSPGIRGHRMNAPTAGGSLSRAFFALLRRDLLLAFRRRTELLFPVIFLLVVISLFPLGIGPSPQLLARIAPGVIWIAALLATVISLDALFRSDFEDGTLEQFIISGHP